MSAMTPDARRNGDDPFDSPEYHAFVESMAKDCRCCPDCCGGDIPCDTLLAGGCCDTRCRCEDDRDEEEDDYDPLGCPGCGGNCARACR